LGGQVGIEANPLLNIEDVNWYAGDSNEVLDE
jgi:hypothetical protein